LRGIGTLVATPALLSGISKLHGLTKFGGSNVLCSHFYHLLLKKKLPISTHAAVSILSKPLSFIAVQITADYFSTLRELVPNPAIASFPYLFCHILLSLLKCSLLDWR